MDRRLPKRLDRRLPKRLSLIYMTPTGSCMVEIYGGGKVEMGTNIQRNLFEHKCPFVMLVYHTSMIILDNASHQVVHANAPRYCSSIGTSTHVRNSSGRSSHLDIHIAHLNATCRFSNQFFGLVQECVPLAYTKTWHTIHNNAQAVPLSRLCFWDDRPVKKTKKFFFILDFMAKTSWPCQHVGWYASLSRTRGGFDSLTRWR